MSEPELESLLREHGLPRHNENTISSPRKLREELARVVQNGFSLDDEEDELGLRCIGAPVFDSCGRAIAAVSVSATSAQFTEESYAFLIRETKGAAAAIGDALAQDNLDLNRATPQNIKRAC